MNRGTRSVTTLTVCVVLITAMIAGCAHYPVNRKLEKFDLAQVTKGTALHSPTRSDELFLVLAFSGGGTRAAALAYGVLEGLAQIEVSPPSHPSSSEKEAIQASHRLVHEVDVVSGVSGGSITAAYFALHGDGIFKGFKEEFLYRNVAWGLIGRLLNPYNLIRVGSPYFSRSDLEAEYFDDHLFHGATYKDLEPGKAPHLVIQATDISDGNYFVFAPVYFGLICSDLSAFPLARATAASSSVPGPFGAITLRNYAGQCGFREEAWFTNALAKRDYTSRSYRFATQLQTYREWNEKPFLHLVDGVVSDNLGLRGTLDFMIGTGDSSAALRARGLDKTKRVVFIIVNAETKHSTRHWSLLEEDPGLTDIGDVALTAMINNYTFESVALLRQLVKEWSSLRQDEHPDRQPLAYYLIEVTFNALADGKERQGFLDLPTSFNLTDEQVDRLRHAGQRILFDSPDFQRLVRDLGGKVSGSITTPVAPSP